MKRKKQHHTPRFYLDGFSFKENNNSLIWVCDLETQKWFKATPESIGYIRGFYDIDLKNSVDLVENFFAVVETKVAPILRKIIKDQALPNQQDRAEFLHYLTLQWLRGPNIRNMMSNSIDLLGRVLAERAMDNRKKVEEVLKNAKEGKYGDIPPDKIESMSYEDLVAFVNEGRFDVVPSQDFMVASLLQLANELYPHFWYRSWSIYSSRNKNYNFITSDNPVNLYWKDEKRNDGNLINSPGFGLHGTEVSFALSPNIAIIGEFDASETLNVANNSLIRKLNNRVLRGSFRQIYSLDRNPIL